MIFCWSLQVYGFPDRVGRNVHMTTGAYSDMSEEQREDYRHQNFIHHSAVDYHGLSVVGNVLE